MWYINVVYVCDLIRTGFRTVVIGDGDMMRTGFRTVVIGDGDMICTVSAM